MQANLEAVEQKFEEINARLSDPSVASNPSDLQRLGKERAEIEPLVNKYRESKRLLKELEEARELQKSEDASMREMAREEVTEKREPEGALTVRIPESFGVHRLPEVIRDFHSRCPKVKLNFITCTVEGLEKDLRKGVTDLAFLLAESVNFPDILSETLGFESVVLVAGPDHPLSSKRSVHTRDLAGATILLSRVDCSYRRIFEKILDQEEVRSFNRLEFHSVEVIKRCLEAGIGVSVLPETAVADEVSGGKLVVLPWSEGPIEVAVLMIWYRERWISPTLKAFMETTRKAMARNG